ncbi:unnamed protein product [Ambrosiozyma monospora]|uniref:Unnamed protein product n=1 Tax=Ambrosiozyma monospora TaxID=43982 RepID=A0A9W6YXI6_AMBMO|nr:unnamed protein product [Ambrosiozyma monospora]
MDLINGRIRIWVGAVFPSSQINVDVDDDNVDDDDDDDNVDESSIELQKQPIRPDKQMKLESDGTGVVEYNGDDVVIFAFSAFSALTTATSSRSSGIKIVEKIMCWIMDK